ncbi:MAG TPA: M14 family zinc carboxypeptidase [Bryobacteraceae bacterium]
MPKLLLLALLLMLACTFAWQAAPTDRVADPFASGWMLADTNGDGIADMIEGKVVVPANPTATENAAASDIAARLGFGSTGLTPPLVVNAEPDSAGPRFWIGKSAVPSSGDLPPLLSRLEAKEGAVLALGGNLAIVANDDDGLLTAAESYAARAPYIWRVNGEKLAVIHELANAELVGVTYLRGKAGVHRAFLRSDAAMSSDALAKVLASPRLQAVHELVVLGPHPASAVSERAEAAAAPSATPAASDAAGAADANAAPARLDLATLYTTRGLFGASGRIPVPATINGHLYVPAGAAGIAMANLAARMGLESIGIALPIATPVAQAAVRDVRVPAVIAGDGPLAEQALRIGQAESLPSGEGELRVVDNAFGRRAAILARGDSSAIDLLANRFPNLWEQGKQHLSLEEIRYDLHRFFSRRSGVGQAAAAVYHLERWTKALDPDAKNVKAEVYVELADPRLADFIRTRFHADVQAASLHAGTRCCTEMPSLHFRAPGMTFQQTAPTFAEDIVIPWEGRRLADSVKKAAAGIVAGQPVKLLARVSEGAAERRKLEGQLKDVLVKAGSDPRRTEVEVLCAYKPGYSWLMDEIAPALAHKPVASIRIEFAKNVDTTGLRAMHSEARWVQELYPVDEMLARKLDLPLDKITLEQMVAGGPTYRVHALDGAGKEILVRDFTVPTVMQPYNGVITRYEQVQVDTGWVKLEAAGKTLLDQRVKTDIEEFWDHYQNTTLPRVFQSILSQARGDLRTEFQPHFDTLKIDIHLSEPDYNLDLDKERISSLEALQEDAFYSTGAFIGMMGDLEAGRNIPYTGRIIPVVHGSEDGKDGRVRIEYYGKAAAHPLVRLTWTDAAGKPHGQERSLPALSGEMQPRLIDARVMAGVEGVEQLGWTMPADFAEDQYEEWLKVEGQDQVDRSIFSVEQARGQLHWLEAMHEAGLYRDDLTYPNLRRMAVEFELPHPLSGPADARAPRETASFAVVPPAHARPQIAGVPKIATNPMVQWNEPIGPAESASVLARLATHPGVNVYWMGRTYLGEDIWAADLTLPSPALLRSAAKETTLKASIVYSGRQHANEVSSTSHILKLAEELVNDPAKRALLKQVNVVIHPITNPDGAELAVALAKITPDNMLHPGYHGALSADVSSGQTETDPIYPESRTRRQLIEAWLPDAFLNPHGYPSHEWVQPFSEYTGWVQTRQGANPGRAWWIPRGWFTSLGYLRDDTHVYSKQIAYTIQDRIVEAMRNVPGLLPVEERMNARYERFGQRWQPRDMFQPVVNGIRIYMALKGAGGRGGAGAGGQGGEGGAAAPAPGSGGVGGLSPDVTWDAGYTEAPDETAHGDWMKLMASAGLAFDYVHLKYLAEGDLRIARTTREQGGAVQWRIERPRPILPAGVAPPATPAQ